MNKILVILGPTATGKSDMTVKLARKYKGEVISADSRQVYRGLNIGTGKITKKEMRGVPHHLLDVVYPGVGFTVAEWKKTAEKKIDEIISRGKVPIICGGTGFYIQSIIDNITPPEVMPNIKLRTQLKNKPVDELYKILKKLDPRRAKNIDQKNPVRLIRAIEIATSLGAVPNFEKLKGKPTYKFLQIGLDLPDNVLKEKIHKRLIIRMKKGMVSEANKLHQNGLSWKRMKELGLEYGLLADLISKKITKQEFTKNLEAEIWQYVRRQRIWFKKDKRIHWFFPQEHKKVIKEIDTFLKKG